MPARAARDADADYSFLDKQCSSVINCCSFRVCPWLPWRRARLTAVLARRSGALTAGLY
jgi:hypothetical protein